MDVLSIKVRRHNGQYCFGPWLDSGDEDVPGWVRAMIDDEIAETDLTEGRVEQGGSIWRWRLHEIPNRTPVEEGSMRHELKRPDPAPGARLASALARAGVSQVELSRRLGASRPYVSDVLAGRKRPSLEWLHAAAMVLGISPHELDERLAPARQ